MTNLLPPTAKKHIVFEYWVRVVSTWVIFWSLCLLISAVLLWPTYVLIVGSSAAFADSVKDASARTAEYDGMSESLTQATKQAQTVIIHNRQTKLSQLFTDMTNTAGQGIRISDVRITRGTKQMEPMQVQGVATDRQSLAQFRDRLELLPYVASVDLPIENLAQNQDIEFNLSVTINSQAL